jgi:dTDP-4-dehydrorhamnose 3,5-epimerase
MEINNFKQDAPLKIATCAKSDDSSLIKDVEIFNLNGNSDDRGCLVELLSNRDRENEPIVHVYKVEAESKSYRGFVYHKWQKDRLAFTEGNFLILLKDLRESSPTFQNEMKINAGQNNKILLVLPEYIAHSVENLGERASFINMPTNIYNPENPDKFRYIKND